jgi:hypothetical protein
MFAGQKCMDGLGCVSWEMFVARRRLTGVGCVVDRALKLEHARASR